MGPREEKTRRSLAIWDDMVAKDEAISASHRHIVLSMLKGILDPLDPDGYERGTAPLPTDEEAEDWLNSIYAVLGHHETARLSEGLNGD